MRILILVRSVLWLYVLALHMMGAINGNANIFLCINSKIRKKFISSKKCVLRCLHFKEYLYVSQDECVLDPHLLSGGMSIPTGI